MERFTPELRDKHPQLYYEHAHRYLLAKEHIEGGRVLDLACGEGYGSAILAQTADFVLGIDKDQSSIETATVRYPKANLNYLAADCSDTKLESQTFDYIVSFETIEHLESPQAFIAEIRRLLRPSGLLIISSPDKKEYSETNEITNPYHLNELYQEEFKELLSTRFSNCHFATQRLVAGSLIQSEKTAALESTLQGIFSGDLETSSFDKHMQQGLYSLAFCSDAPLPTIKLGLFENKQDSDFSWDATEQYRPTLKKLLEAHNSLKNRGTPASVESLLNVIADIEKQNQAAQNLIASKDDEIVKSYAVAEQLRSEVAELLNRVARQNDLTKMVEEERDNAIAQRDNFQERYENIKSTFSWKATVPIRTLRRIVDRIRSK